MRISDWSSDVCSSDLIRECDRSDLLRTPLHQLDEPGSFAAVSFGVAYDGHRADHEHLSQISVARARYAAEPILAATGVLSRDQADPRSEVPARLDHVRIGAASNAKIRSAADG